MCHISDGHPQGPNAVLVHQAHGIVEILCIGRVNRHKGKVAKVGAPVRDFTITVHFAQEVGVVDQRRIVVTRERVVAFGTTCFKAGVQQLTRTPASGLKHQQRHRRFILLEAQA